MPTWAITRSCSDSISSTTAVETPSSMATLRLPSSSSSSSSASSSLGYRHIFNLSLSHSHKSLTFLTAAKQSSKLLTVVARCPSDRGIGCYWYLAILGQTDFWFLLLLQVWICRRSLLRLRGEIGGDPPRGFLPESSGEPASVRPSVRPSSARFVGRRYANVAVAGAWLGGWHGSGRVVRVVGADSGGGRCSERLGGQEEVKSAYNSE